MTILCLAATGCQSTPQSESVGDTRLCPPGRALICTRKFGKDEACSCEREETFEEIFKPDRR